MSHIDDIKNLLVEHRRRLQKRREQKARQGINTPPEILTEIEDIESSIEKLRTELQELELNNGDGKSSADAPRSSDEATHQNLPNQKYERIDRYEIIEMLGKGGMGKVYRAIDPHLNREVVLKMIDFLDPDGDTDELHQRFEREVRIAGSLNHPHIVTVHDVVFDHDPPYVVMELLAGGTLKQHIKSKVLSWQEALVLLIPLAEALAYAHRTEVIHRDVKPDNIMFAGDEANTLKLVDFGLARWETAEKLTQIGTFVGTPAYMSPEQVKGEQEIDKRTDIFSLGIILYEAIVGNNPLSFGKTLPLTIMFNTASDEPVDLKPLIDVAPPEVVNLIGKALAKNREQRYSTCEELLDDIAVCLSEQSVMSIKSHDAKPTKKQSVIEIEPPYGTMHPDSKFYIERSVDRHCSERFKDNRASTLFIQAPRQMGKSSLIQRILAQFSRTTQKAYAFIDFQKFPEHYFADEEKFLIEFCLMISDALGIPEQVDEYWQGRRTNIVKCSRYISYYVLPQLKMPLILAMDEVERMLTSSFRSNFFGMLRTWHNDRVHNEEMAKLTLFLSSSTEPYLFVDNPKQSPFNVAEIYSLQDFTKKEVKELNLRHNFPLGEKQIDKLVELLSGHPFLTRLALYLVATGKIDVETLFDRAVEDNGPFGDHLRYYLLHIQERPDLKQALAHICKVHQYEENRTFYRLKGAGLIKKVGHQVVLRNRLYTQYFEERFNVG